MLIEIKQRKILVGLLIATLPLVVKSQALTIKDQKSKKIAVCKYNFLKVIDTGQMELEIEDISSCTKQLTTDETVTDETVTDETLAGKWKSDPHEVGDRVTSIDLYNGEGSPESTSDKKFKVFTIGGGLLTAVPACANQRDTNSCRDWSLGAKTDEVYAVRKIKNTSHNNLYLSFAPLLYGNNITTSRYDVTISKNPGEMNKSDFRGDGCVNTSNKNPQFRIALISTASANKNEFGPNSCYIEDGKTYYINIRATNSKCDLNKQPRTDSFNNIIGVYGSCNSFYSED